MKKKRIISFLFLLVSVLFLSVVVARTPHQIQALAITSADDLATLKPEELFYVTADQLNSCKPDAITCMTKLEDISKLDKRTLKEVFAKNDFNFIIGSNAGKITVQPPKIIKGPFGSIDMSNYPSSQGYSIEAVGIQNLHPTTGKVISTNYALNIKQEGISTTQILLPVGVTTDSIIIKPEGGRLIITLKTGTIIINAIEGTVNGEITVAGDKKREFTITGGGYEFDANGDVGATDWGQTSGTINLVNEGIQLVNAFDYAVNAGNGITLYKGSKYLNFKKGYAVIATSANIAIGDVPEKYRTEMLGIPITSFVGGNLPAQPDLKGIMHYFQFVPGDSIDSSLLKQRIGVDWEGTGPNSHLKIDGNNNLEAVGRYKLIYRLTETIPVCESVRGGANECGHKKRVPAGTNLFRMDTRQANANPDKVKFRVNLNIKKRVGSGGFADNVGPTPALDMSLSVPNRPLFREGSVGTFTLFDIGGRGSGPNWEYDFPLVAKLRGEVPNQVPIVDMNVFRSDFPYEANPNRLPRNFPFFMTFHTEVEGTNPDPPLRISVLPATDTEVNDDLDDLNTGCISILWCDGGGNGYVVEGLGQLGEVNLDGDQQSERNWYIKYLPPKWYQNDLTA